MSGRKCSVCLHSERIAIDQAIAARESFRGISRQFVGLSPDAVERHAKAHVPKDLAKASETTRAQGLLAGVMQQRARAEALFQQAQAVLRQARRRKDHHTTLDAIRAAATALREARGVLDLLLRAAIAHGELVDRQELREAFEGMLGVVREFIPDPEKQRALGARLRALVEGGARAIGRDRIGEAAVPFLQPAGN